MEKFDEVLASFLGLMNAGDKKLFAKFGLNLLFSLRHLKMNDSFLRAATYFWDDKVHVFRFQFDELCPIFEDFCALFGVKPIGPFVYPTVRRCYLDTLVNLLEVPKSSIMSFIHGGFINLESLACAFLHYDARVSLTKPRQHALAICLLGRYLLASGSLLVPIQLCELLLPLSESKNIVPMVLAETLNGLDAARRGSAFTLRGSPLLLQMWLMERLSLLHPSHYPNYKPSHYCTRRLDLPDAESVRDWVFYLYKDAS
ncbi:hypothetical protein HGI15_22055, partial [Modestobacter lapidis]|nr:hypothetical protein [Modestobacter lapidis]